MKPEITVSVKTADRRWLIFSFRSLRIFLICSNRHQNAKTVLLLWIHLFPKHIISNWYCPLLPEDMFSRYSSCCPEIGWAKLKSVYPTLYPVVLFFKQLLFFSWICHCSVSIHGLIISIWKFDSAVLHLIVFLPLSQRMVESSPTSQTWTQKI